MPLNYSPKEFLEMIQEAKDSALRGEHLRVELLDIDRLVKVNEIKEVTNPITFQRNNVPTVDGLLSNEIFGITMYDRSNTCAYIGLQEYFLNPIVYKVWSKLDKKIVDCVHGTKKFIINGKGELEENEDGESGVKFLKKNFDKINIARTASVKRDLNVDFLESCKKSPGTFINKFLVSPAYYRDVDTSKEGKVAIGEINELYRNLLIATRSLKESRDYGLDMTDATRGRIQELITKIFNWYGNGTTINGTTTGANIPGKRGVIRRAVMSKTTDYATRLVMSAPELKFETVDDVVVNLEYSAVPLASVLTNFKPFIIFYIKRLFENAFSGDKTIVSPEGVFHVKDYQAQFSEERIDKEISRFLTGVSNRLIPIEIEVLEDTPNGKNTGHLYLKGFQTTLEEYNKHAGNMEATERWCTWCDIFFMAAVDVTQDKHILVVRYPIKCQSALSEMAMTKLCELLGTLNMRQSAAKHMKVQRLSYME